jgi:hypothetical protein
MLGWIVLAVTTVTNTGTVKLDTPVSFSLGMELLSFYD